VKKGSIVCCGIFSVYLAALAVPIPGGKQASDDIVRLSLLSPVDKLRPGEEHRLAVEIQIASPFHINSSRPKDEALIPTQISFSGPEGVTFGRIEYPAPIVKTFDFASAPLEVYEGTVRIFTSVRLSKGFAKNEVMIHGRLEYQACDSTTCLPPAEIEFRKVFPVAAPVSSSPTIQATAEESGALQEHAEIDRPAQELKNLPEKEAAPATGEGAFALTVQERGLLLTFILVFIGGLGLSLTPCVYPLIPITIGYFGGQAKGRKGGVLIHALFYVLGMAFTYSALGVAAALTGSLFGGALQNPVVLLIISAVMIALALSMFDLYEFRLPSFLSRLAGGNRKGYLGTLFMGLTVGIVAAPCIGPFVLGLLTYVGERGDAVLGFLMFFILALGLGIPFLFLAVFSGSLDRLPRSGLWMVWVRKIFGFVLLGMAVYFIRPLFPSTLSYHLALSMIFIAGGVYMAWIEPTKLSGRAFSVLRQLTGILFFAVGLIIATQGIQGYVEERIESAASTGGLGGPSAETGIRWSNYSDEALAQAKDQSLPVLIDFYADWCLPCKELDRFTFPEPEVVALSRRFVMLKVDLTSSRDPAANRLKKKYQIKGVPTLVFLKSDGREAPELRIVGFVKKETLLARMSEAMGAAR